MGSFSVKDFSATSRVRILKFGTKVDSDKLYCVTKQTAFYCLSVPLFARFFFLSKKNFCHRLLGSYRSQCIQILFTPSDSKSALCKRRLRCSFSLCLLFQIFNYSFCHSYIIHMDI